MFELVSWRPLLVLASMGFVVGAAPEQPAPDAATIVQRIESRWQGLDSYEVPVTIYGSVRVSFISVPVRMTGTQYYQAPNRQALHIDNPPAAAKGLGDTLSTMGTPETWSQDYTMAVSAQPPHGHHASFVLVGTPKRPSRVKSVTMWVSQNSYGIESMTFDYTNGATLVVTMHRKPGLTQFHLPRSADISAHFPGYSGNATIQYGEYKVNQPIPASAFDEQH